MIEAATPWVSPNISQGKVSLWVCFVASSRSGEFSATRIELTASPMRAAGIAFEDDRISFEQFGQMRNDLTFRSVPVLEIDGAVATQSTPLSRYVGKMAGLYPDDDLQALYCDEAMGAVEDLTHYVVQSFGLPDDELQIARERLVDGWMSVYLVGLDKLLARSGGQYFADGRVTIADLKVLGQTQALRTGRIDHIPTDLVDRLAPGLVAHQALIEADPVVQAYYATRSAS